MKIMLDTQVVPLPQNVVLVHDREGKTFTVLVTDTFDDELWGTPCDDKGEPQGMQMTCEVRHADVVGVIVGGFDYDTSDGAA